MQEITFRTPGGELFILPVEVTAELTLIKAEQLNKEEAECQKDSQLPS